MINKAFGTILGNKNSLHFFAKRQFSLPAAIFGVGKNYIEHAKEMGGSDQPLENMLIFMKNPNALIGNGQAIRIPKICQKNGPQVDFEGELALIIGEDCKNVALDEAISKIGWYAVANDVSARWWQKKGSGGQFCRGKSFDTFCPMSEPVKANTVKDPQNLRIITKVNGVKMQDGQTAHMIFPVKQIVSELS